MKEPPIIPEEEVNKLEEDLEFIDPNPTPILNQTEEPALNLTALGPKKGPEIVINNETIADSEDPIKLTSFTRIADRDFRFQMQP